MSPPSKITLLLWTVALGCAPVLLGMETGTETGENPSEGSSFVAPSGLDFSELILKSPFTRSLNLPGTLILTGVAEIESKTLVTLIDTKTKDTHTVSDIPNERGWRLVEVSQIGDLEKTSAKIAINGGEIITVFYEKDKVVRELEAVRRELKERMARARGDHGARPRHGRGHDGNAGGAGGSPNGKLLTEIDRNELPKGYNPGLGKNPGESHFIHQDYVDRRLAGMSNEQKGRVGKLWAEKQKIDPGMPNRGASFVRIMEHVANDKR